jgi:hypothetical protein
MPPPVAQSRVARLQAFEYLIFVVLLILLALCLAAAPFAAVRDDAPGAAPPGAPGETRVL